MAQARLAMDSGDKFLQDAAALMGTLPCAGGTQLQELFFEGLHAFKARTQTAEFAVDQFVDVTARVLRCVQRTEETFYIGQRNIQGPAVPHKGEAFEMGIGIVAVAVGKSCRLGKKAFFFIETDGFGINARGTGQILDLHGSFHFSDS